MTVKRGWAPFDGRLFQAEDGPAKRQFLYDPGSGSGAGSAHIIAEYDTGGTVLKRYVRVPGGDEVLVEYDGVC